MYKPWNKQQEQLTGIYHSEDLELQQSRYNALIERFTTWQGKGDYLIARAPGRVNIIGEHTDYNHCPVLPCAVDRDIIAVFTPRTDGKIIVADFIEKYGEREFQITGDLPPFPSGNWGNYIKAAIQGLHSEGVLDLNDKETKGYSMMMHSTIPAAAGMSSSSAMVVLSAIVALHVNDKEVAPLDLAEMMARAERYTGTQGGGMDQAAILLGHKGSALKIDFAPLKCETTPFPEDYQILIAHSTIEAPKTKEIMDKYNRRSIECRLAAGVISSYELQKGRKSIAYLGELTPDYPFAQALKDEGYSKLQLQEILSLEEEELNSKYCQRKDGTIFPEPEGGFLLFKRAFHVISEWKRVEESAQMLREGKIKELGELMYASHESCRDNHEISCRELDLLVECGKGLGSPGCRLTGAGFGGCTVHISHENELDSYIDGLKNCFYKGNLGLSDARDYLFSVYPSEGAQILKKL
ncbi:MULTISPECIES: galactokinase [unclassified Oceanispirochaeta]|uniref:galactokinase n=1 Tax=unclassified Oceanispirochaeta TaxID=2635722 RepID=UPI001314EF21|nr:MULTISPECIES: galactokinase [unclassified Oceanispirochaeta]MBF9017725.1 galactokinase [Oceanispirochaeta sp. M2]NPD72128.1 galactokinase [Oceanispirochaeta sp. M1]